MRKALSRSEQDEHGTSQTSIGKVLNRVLVSACLDFFFGMPTWYRLRSTAKTNVIETLGRTKHNCPAEGA